MNGILNNITDGVATYDRNGRFTFVNERGAEIAGQTPQELIGKRLREVYPEAIAEIFQRELQRVVEESVPVSFQEFYPPLNIWLEVRAYPIQSGALVLYQDITDWKQSEVALQQAYGELSTQIVERTAELRQTNTQLEMQRAERRRIEEALRVSNEQLARILQSITDGFCAVNLQWQFTYINLRAEQILQRQQSELLGRNLWEMFPQMIGSRFYQRCVRAAETRESTQFEYFCSSLDRWFHIAMYSSPEGISIYFQDVTYRKQIERERDRLLQQEQAARAKAEVAQQRCLFLADASSVLAASLNYETTLWNVTRLVVSYLADFCLVYRLEGDRLRKVTAVHSESQQQGLVDELGTLYQTSLASTSPIAQVLRTGNPMLINDFSQVQLTTEPQTLTIFQELAPRSLILAPLIARGQKLGAMILAIANSNRQYGALDLAVATDLAHRVGMAVDNAQLYQEAQQSSRLKDEFLATLSHELRTPLNTIVGWAQMLRFRQLSQRTTEQAIEAIERKARALTQVVYDLLSVSRIITGQFRFKPRVVSLDIIVHEVINSLHLAISAKAIHLDTSIAPAIAPLRGDPRYLRQIVWNLLSNAIKFTPMEGDITLRLTQVGAVVRLQVVDSGQGIVSSFLPYVFDHFRQADGTVRRSNEGLGLGLSLVRHLVDLHGGTVYAFSEGEGRGSTFTVELPISRTSDPSASTEPATALDGQLLDDLQILLIDAEFDSRDPLATQLEHDGAEVIAVASAADAMEIIEHFNPSVLLVNISTLEPVDVELLSQLRTNSLLHPQPLTAIALTLHSSEEERLQALSMGFQVYLSKRTQASELSTVVAAIARQAR